MPYSPSDFYHPKPGMPDRLPEPGERVSVHFHGNPWIPGLVVGVAVLDDEPMIRLVPDIAKHTTVDFFPAQEYNWKFIEDEDS